MNQSFCAAQVDLEALIDHDLYDPEKFSCNDQCIYVPCQNQEIYQYSRLVKVYQQILSARTTKLNIIFKITPYIYFH